MFTAKYLKKLERELKHVLHGKRLIIIALLCKRQASKFQSLCRRVHQGWLQWLGLEGVGMFEHGLKPIFGVSEWSWGRTSIVARPWVP